MLQNVIDEISVFHGFLDIRLIVVVDMHVDLDVL